MIHNLMTFVQQIESSLEWQAGKIICGNNRTCKSSTPEIFKLTKALAMKKGRSKQEVEIYQMEHRAKVNKMVDDEVERLRAMGAKERMTIRCHVVIRELMAEDPDV